MKLERLQALCIRLGVEPSPEHMVAALHMSRREGERYLRAISQQRKEPSKDLLCTPIIFWPDDDLRRATNDKRLAARLLLHAKEENLKLLYMAAKHRNESRQREDILRYLESIDEADVQEARQAAADEHHPEQGRLFGGDLSV